MTGHQAESQPLHPTNPFSTRAVRPGALDYHFPPDDSLATLLDRLRDHHGWGEIVGPHGSGKSTLIHTLRQAVADDGRNVKLFKLSAVQRRLPVNTAEMEEWDAQTQVLVDGYEQLSGWRRWALKRTCRRRGCGLLITAHASFGFPLILSTTTSLDLTDQLVSALLPDDDAHSISAAEIENAFSRHAGNIREVFFDLYDRYEQRARR